MANIFERWIDRRIEQRARIINEDGQIAGGTVDLRGLWGSTMGARDADLTSLRPSATEATKVSEVAARALNLRIQQLAARPLSVTSEQGEAVDHALERLFNKKPNTFQSARAFRASYLTRLFHIGEAFIILDRGSNRVGDPRSAVVHYGKVDVVVSKPTAFFPQGQIVGFRAQVGDDFVALAPTEVLWLRYEDPENPWGCRAPIDAALDSIGIARAARRWQAGQLVNGGQAAGIIYLGDVKDDERDMAIDEIDNALNGPSSAGRFAVAAGATAPKYIKTGLTAQEVGYLDTLTVAGENIALALGIPLDLIGGQRTYANVEASWKILWEGTLLNDLALIESEIDRQLLSDSRLIAHFDTSDVAALQEGRDAVAARVAKATELDILFIDEAREALGFDPMADGKGAMTRSEYLAKFGGNAVSPVAGSGTQGRMLTPETDNRALEGWTDAGRGDATGADVDHVFVGEQLSASEGGSDGLSHQVRGISADTINRDLDRLEEAAKRAVVRLAEAAKREAKKRLNRNQRSADIPADANFVFNAAAWAERAYEYLLPALYAAMDSGASATAAALGLNLQIDAFINQAVEERAVILGEQVIDTTRKVLTDKLAAAAIADRITVKQFADVIDAVFEDLATWRADTIARTEMVGAYNSGSRKAALESGVTSAREWLATGDTRTRPDHSAMNGVRTVSMDDPYTLPDGSSVMFPGDPSGPASQTINCRCVELYVTTYSTEESV